MRRITILLIILLHSIGGPAEAFDTVLGTVVSVDREKGEMIVRLTRSPALLQKKSEQGQAFASDVTVHFTRDSLCKGIKNGELVRLWGSFESGSTNTFTAAHIRRGSRRSRDDPTGVRSRLGKFRGKGGGRQHGGGGRKGR